MSQLKLTVVADPSRFRAGMSAVQKDLFKLRSTANTVSQGINKAFGAAGIGLTFAAFSQVLKQSTKAAVEDSKSQALLANALRNTVGATSGAIAGAEKYIAKTQLSASVLDDELRPALATAVRATGSLSKGQDLLNTALDVSAGTGKDLGTVTNAISKAFNGNTGALRKLLPSIKDGADFMEQLKEQFEGSADIAAKNDPYKRLQILFEDIQETIGAALIPALEEFTEYLTSTEGQKNLQQIVNLFVEAGKAVSTVTKFVVANIGVIKALVAALITMKLGWMAITGAVKAYDFAVKIAAISTKALRTALVTTGFGAIAVALGFVAEAFITASESADKFNTAVKASDLKPGETYWDFQKRKASEAWSNSYTAKAAMEAKGSVKKVGKAISDGLSEGAKQITKTAERFRDSVGLALGTFGKDENSVFNVDVVINKLKRMVDAAKGFAGNLEKLRKQGAGADVISEIVGMGPAQGNIVAKGLLQSGKLSQYLGLRGSLFNTGAQVGAIQESTEAKTYEININKANVSAEDIIKAIRTFEKKSGRKYFAF
jgi:hypothetical protein